MNGSAVLVALVVGAIGFTVLASAVAGGVARQRGDAFVAVDRRGRRVGAAVRAVLLAVSVAAVVSDQRAGVFWTVVALNVGVGFLETVPLSAYGMFASPAETAWVVRVETTSGDLVPIGAFGVPPGEAHKRFSAVEHEAQAGGADADAARDAAVSDLVGWIVERRRGHPTAGVELHLVHTTWRLHAGGLDIDRRPLAVIPPA